MIRQGMALDPGNHLKGLQGNKTWLTCTIKVFMFVIFILAKCGIASVYFALPFCTANRGDGDAD